MLDKIYWRHKNMKDVCFMTLETKKSKGGLELLGYWVNIACKDTHWPIDTSGPVTIKITAEAIAEWEAHQSTKSARMMAFRGK